MNDTAAATDTTRQELIEKLVRAEVDRWDMDTTVEYAVEQMIDNMEDADDGTLGIFWEEVFGEDDNPFDEE